MEDGLVIVVMVVLEEARGIWYVIDAEKNTSVKSKQQQERRYFCLPYVFLSICSTVMHSQFESRL